MTKFTELYMKRVKLLGSPSRLKNDSINRFIGKHPTPLMKYEFSGNLLKPGGIYIFDYDNKSDIDLFNNKKSLFYDKSPLILITSNDYNQGLNLNLLQTNDRIKLFSVMHDYSNYKINNNRNPKQFKSMLIDSYKISNLLSINNVPYSIYDLKHARNIYMIDSSEIVNICDLYMDSINLHKGMTKSDLYKKIKK